MNRYEIHNRTENQCSQNFKVSPVIATAVVSSGESHRNKNYREHVARIVWTNDYGPLSFLDSWPDLGLCLRAKNKNISGNSLISEETHGCNGTEQENDDSYFLLHPVFVSIVSVDLSSWLTDVLCRWLSDRRRNSGRFRFPATGCISIMCVPLFSFFLFFFLYYPSICFCYYFRSTPAELGKTPCWPAVSAVS